MMAKSGMRIVLACCCAFASNAGDAEPAPEHIHHSIRATISPDQHHIGVDDRLIFPDDLDRSRPLVFVLDAGLVPTISSGKVRLRKIATNKQEQSPVQRYTLEMEKNVSEVRIHYEGSLDHELRTSGRDMRRFQDPPGHITEKGVYLDAATAWYPQFDNYGVTFSVELNLPQGWDAVSQGRRNVHKRGSENSTVQWQTEHPQEGIYVVAAPFTEYHRETGKIRQYAFLRTADDELAHSYLETAARYIALFEKLLGPYPYSKFALVENFWQSGLGMPSFTLLGSKIIRFPFILHSSFPHEILHNWLGNGVYVDYKKGNWSEGLTSYLADHLIQEMAGHSAEYRRVTLQKFTDYVSANKDFPLAAFTGRNSPASEAVGYGKTLMFFHMLRLRMSDTTFTAALRRFVQVNLYRRASFDDLRRAFSEETGWDLEAEFQQWIERSGAPKLRCAAVGLKPAGGGYRLEISLEQVQKDPVFDFVVPIAVTLQGVSNAMQTSVLMNQRRVTAKIATAERPVRVDIDPEFDVFRILNSDERPPTVSEILGAEKLLIVLPTPARFYTDFAMQWRRHSQARVDIVRDSDLEALPKDRPVWLLGRDNRFFPEVSRFVQTQGAVLAHSQLEIPGKKFAIQETASVIAARAAGQGSKTLMWTAAPDQSTLTALLRKLPHYGKYSYLIFSRSGADNVGKGIWLPVRSSLVRAPGETRGTGKLPARARLRARTALVDVRDSGIR